VVSEKEPLEIGLEEEEKKKIKEPKLILSIVFQAQQVKLCLNGRDECEAQRILLSQLSESGQVRRRLIVNADFEPETEEP
jgi:hypothetical protein